MKSSLRGERPASGSAAAGRSLEAGLNRARTPEAGLVRELAEECGIEALIEVLFAEPTEPT